jgi:DNA polymerase-1
MERHILLLDASGFAYRSFYAGSPVYRESDGEPIGAILGFMGLLWRLLGAAQADQPTHAVAVFDHPGPTFRHKLFPAYKANRNLARARQQELKRQLPVMRAVAGVMGLAPMEVEGFEGDDVIATLAAKAVKDGIRVTIVSADKDFCSLVQDGKVEIIDPMNRTRVLEADVRGRKFGVDPKRVPDVQALAGDPVDNIPGIDGIGLKTAAGLIRALGSIEGVAAAVHTDPQLFNPGARVAIKRAGLKTLQLYRTLATLRPDVPVEPAWSELELKPIVREHVEQILKALGAERRFEAVFSTEPKMQRVVEASKDAFVWWAKELKSPGQAAPEDPQCGFYRRRLVRGGPWVVARIWREPEVDFMTGKPTGLDVLQCELGGERRDPVIEWLKLCSHPIEEAEFRYRAATADWAKKHAPHEPEAKPSEKIDWNKVSL